MNYQYLGLVLYAGIRTATEDGDDDRMRHVADDDRRGPSLYWQMTLLSLAIKSAGLDLSWIQVFDALDRLTRMG